MLRTVMGKILNLISFVIAMLLLIVTLFISGLGYCIRKLIELNIKASQKILDLIDKVKSILNINL
jgi:hypothetical protein